MGAPSRKIEALVYAGATAGWASIAGLSWVQEGNLIGGIIAAIAAAAAIAGFVGNLLTRES